jgi:hypothetical protein
MGTMDTVCTDVFGTHIARLWDPRTRARRPGMPPANANYNKKREQAVYWDPLYMPIWNLPPSW